MTTKQDIVIGGVSIAALKAQKQALAKEANMFVKDAVKAGTVAFDLMMNAESQEEANTHAHEALEQFENAALVSGTAGVTFMIPYYEEYGSYESNEVMSHMLENNEDGNEFIEWSYSDNGNVFKKLYDVLSDMEFDAKGWHSSTC